MSKLLGPKLYFFISYQHLKIKLLTFAEKIGCVIEDGFSQNQLDPQGFALIDDQLNLDSIHRIAQQLPILAFSDSLITPLALQHLDPELSLSTFKNTILAAARNLQHNDNIEDILIGRAPCWLAIMSLIELAAQKDCTVLIQGESGTGKEIVARTIHRLSLRSSMPFVPVNCGAIPVDLVESELFGHEKGSFTGAIAPRLGKFEVVAKGTLFLDEIADMPMSMQVKLLRALQERQFERIGSNKILGFHGRLISASHQVLTRLVEQKIFREDLFYRLNVLPIYLPALRERCEDVPHIIERIIQREGLKIDFSRQAIEELMHYRWPGNVRQLQNLLERAEVFYTNMTIESFHIKELLKYEPQGCALEISKNNSLIL
jgi:sigma-54 specific flagellar transcriptional regulator A